MKHIWIVNYYAAPPQYDTHGRHLEFAKYLLEAGYKVTLFSASYVANLNVDLIQDSQQFICRTYAGKYNFVHLKVMPYVGNGLRRMFSIFQFAWKLFRYRDRFDRPDIILHNMHAPFDYYVAKCAKKLSAIYVAEDWDLWPDDFVTFGLISAKNPLMKWAYFKEKQMFEAAKDIIFSFAGGVDYLRLRKLTNTTGGRIDEKRVHYINNGLSLKDFMQNKSECKIIDDDLNAKDTFKIIYLGSIKLVNDVKSLIDAVSLLNNYKKIVLLIYGNGDQRERLVEYVRVNNITNVKFKEERISLAQCAYVLSQSDLNILNYKEPFGQYGISAGKLMQSLGAGKPMICNIPIKYDDVISDYDLGVCELLDTPEKYANAILKIYNLPKDEYNKMCGRVLKVAQCFDYEVLSKKLINIIKSY